MNIDIIVGCQYGSEGKGLVAGMLAEKNKYNWIVSVNSAQAGHTVKYRNDYIVTRQLPSGAVKNHEANILIGAGAIVNPKVLIAEIEYLEKMIGISIMDRLFIHKSVISIDDSCIDEERNKLNLLDKIGSTCEGVGVANSRRAIRTARLLFDYFLRDPDLYHNYLNKIKWVDDSLHIVGNVLLEGSQGFGLSIFSKHYPQCTSRDTTTAAFLSYARLSPRNIQHIYGVYRTFPIRVAGNSGYMFNEISWENLAKMSGYDSLQEITTVTKRVRRVGMWDSQLAQEATKVNGVNRPILTFGNYLDKNFEDHPELIDRHKEDKANHQIFKMESDIKIPWYAISTSKNGGWWFNREYY